MITSNFWLTGLVSILVVGICVSLHYEGLRLLSDWLPSPQHKHRKRIVMLILCLLVLHVAEIWVFGLAFYGLVKMGAGELVGISQFVLYDCVYFSAAAFTTIGFGDIVPTGPLRTLTGMEGITGLTMITWSASYTYMEMTKSWDHSV